MDAINTTEYKGYTIELHYDDVGESPREWDNLATMAIFHRNYTLGDKHNFADAGELIDYINENEDDLYVLPIYMYDHSGVTISTSPFNCSFDSGQVGFIYMTKEDAIKNQVPDPIAAMQSEVKTYDQYIRGEVYGYKIFDDEETEVDSCWGYIGDSDYCEADAKQLVDYYDRTNPKQCELELA